MPEPPFPTVFFVFPKGAQIAMAMPGIPSTSRHLGSLDRIRNRCGRLVLDVLRADVCLEQREPEIREHDLVAACHEEGDRTRRGSARSAR
jgi:hypothetical protein